jgi:putative membrane protein
MTEVSVKLLIRLLISAAALWGAAEILPNMAIEDGLGNLLLVALIFGIVNALIRPVAKLLTLPLRVTTLGLFTIVVNGLMVVITSWVLDVLVLDGGILGQLLVGTAAAVIISLISVVLSFILPDAERD